MTRGARPRTKEGPAGESRAGQKLRRAQAIRLLRLHSSEDGPRDSHVIASPDKRWARWASAQSGRRGPGESPGVGERAWLAAAQWHGWSRKGLLATRAKARPHAATCAGQHPAAGEDRARTERVRASYRKVVAEVERPRWPREAFPTTRRGRERGPSRGNRSCPKQGGIPTVKRCGGVVVLAAKPGPAQARSSGASRAGAVRGHRSRAAGRSSFRQKVSRVAKTALPSRARRRNDLGVFASMAGPAERSTSWHEAVARQGHQRLDQRAASGNKKPLGLHVDPPKRATRRETRGSLVIRPTGQPPGRVAHAGPRNPRGREARPHRERTRHGCS